MALPTANDVRTYLEGYEVSVDVLSDEWLSSELTDTIIPLVESKIKRSLEGTEEVTEYLSGNGTPILMLSRRPVVSLVSLEYVTGTDDYYDASIGLGGVRLIADQGMIKSISNITEGNTSLIFGKGNRNIKVTYIVGSTTIESDLKKAVIKLCAESALGFIGARTGGGAITVQGFSRNFGTRGKYQDIRNDLSRQAWAVLRKYMTSVVGNVK